MSLRCWFVAAACFGLATLASPQTPQPPSTPERSINAWTSVPQPNVPSDPLEVAGNAEPVHDVSQRAAAVKLLNNAQFLSNLRRGSYDLKTQFTSSQGTWQIEDSSPGRNIYRWTVQGPSYLAVNLFLDQVIYSNQPSTAIPLRMAQVHSAIFAHYPAYGPRATLRLATGSMNGTQVTCVLVSHVFNAQPVSGPRRWEEYESCIDPQSGLLMSYSPVPGMYVAYDYSNAQRLGDIIVPGKFTITEAGQTVVEAQVLSLRLPPNADSSMYTPAGLNQLGVGFPLTPPWRMQSTNFAGRASKIGAATAGQFVVVRGMLAPDGNLTDAEVLASSDPAFNQEALERSAQPHRLRPQDDQDGATQQSHEAFFTTLFVTN